MKWCERVKVKNILEGDYNTCFFHLVANGKHRKQQIFKLEQDDCIIVGDNELKKYITIYYKGLSGQPHDNNLSLVDYEINNTPSDLGRELKEQFNILARFSLSCCEPPKTNTSLL
jgi:hypothetical protein